MTINPNKKQWSDSIIPLTGSSSFSFHTTFKSKIKDYLEKEEHFIFHLVALVTLQDKRSNRKLYYWQSLPVIINISQPELVSISGLEDVPLSEAQPTYTMQACIYSSTGMVSVFLDGANSQTGTVFRLINTASPPDEIPYYLQFATKESGEKLIEYEGFEEEKFWKVPSATLECAEDNTTITIGLNPAFLKNAATGTYSDTMTVTVTPE